MIKVLGIGGEPATGKSTLMLKFLDSLNEEPRDLEFGLSQGHIFPKNKVIVIGLYYNQKKYHLGTDRLHDLARHHIHLMLENIKDNPTYHGVTILFEGDVLFNKRFIAFLKRQNIEHKLIVLTCAEGIKDIRHIRRKDSQSDQFIEKKEDKYIDMFEKVSGMQTFVNENLDHQEAILKFMNKYIGKKEIEITI